MSVELGRLPEPVGWAGNRNFIVPPDIIPVRRVSPLPKKKRTLCRPRPEGEPICRSGNREWFGNHVFVDYQTRDLRVAHGSSVTAHASCLIGLLVLLAGQPAPTSPVRVSSPLRMPAFVAVSGVGGGGSTPHMTLVAPERRVAPPPKGRAAKTEPPRKSSTNAPSNSVAAERGADNEQHHNLEETRTEGAEDTHVGDPDGVIGSGSNIGESTAGGGNGEGTGTGDGAAGAGGGSSGYGMSPGPYRLGKGIEPPRKIKDVAPIYPSGALASRALGTVLIEAVVGADGKVHDAKVVHSIPLLDRAALDAVRQWEFEPSKLNGVAVAVIVTVLVQFSIY